MAFSAQAVVNHFLAKGPITMMRLQKLLVLSQGFWLAIHDTPLFEEEITLTRGLVASIWHEFKCFGDSPIDPQIHAVVYTPGQGVMIPEVKDEYAIYFLDRMWGIFKDFTDDDLYEVYYMESYDEISMKKKYKEITEDSARKHQIKKLEKLWELS